MKQGRLTQIRNHRYRLGFWGILVIAAFFRFWKLSQIAPGLGHDEAATAAKALTLVEKPSLAAFNSLQSLGSILYLYLQSLAIRLMGTTVLGIRIVPAALGVLSVYLVYLWVSNWFTERHGLIAAFLYAVTPWVITASRRGDDHSLILLFVPLVLWLLTKALQTRQAFWFAAAGIALGLSLSHDLYGWLLALGFLLTAAVLVWRRRDFVRLYARDLLISIGATLLVLVFGSLGHLSHPNQIISAIKPDLTIPKRTVVDWTNATTKTLLMFNVRGDSDFANNAGSLPQLNFFIGIMFVMGLLYSVAHFNRARYSGLLGLLVVLLIPSFLSINTPDALQALAAAPVAIAIATIGISYLLDIWYGTFPINSAARALGTIPILLLLAITGYQGYKQYFVAWAESPEVYQAYGESSKAISDFFNRSEFSGPRYMIADDYQANVLDFLTHKKSTYLRITAADALKLPTDQDQQIVITNEIPTGTLKDLKMHFPKARLSQHYSEHNDNNELFSIYEVLKP
jgi:4-amino-4-deoxy-L-arabinose transferase-like glycosyltransferase